ncbi:HSF-type DNA-binding-domain-containing protein [Ephemerocybe angulata]|uniref:HSF-type DNA-binding-domain-containing protein n=1 Tax=Ephemerocybe angulata TaxID=980116 RepID=A0A8H6HVC3_9AGAR|nr:HSF-type DNA-binding-domain-containing protein [Tulosesus angulatus]
MSQVYSEFPPSQWPHHLLPSPSPSEHYHHQYFPPRNGLSLNIDGLSVQSPPNLSPVNPPAQQVATPISPYAQHLQGSPFQFDPAEHDDQGLAPPASAHRAVSRSSSSSAGSSQLPRKRSFPSSASSATLVEEPYDDRETPMDIAGYDDLDMRTAYGSSTNGGTSPVDGSGNTSGAEDSLGSASLGGGVGGSMNVLGKPMATNNFVTKLYQMINDAKSAHFIAWTELGTSFVVSNVGEFSRSILGSHFKHNNFSSFVRQLNMYGFHKINRTPRAQRTSTDAQTWEFSHHKFLRGRPDLLDEIKRKALEPDPAIKHRVELPGEVAAQLSAMRDENRKMQDQLTNERQRVEKLVNVVGRLWDVVGKSFPGAVGQFPTDLLDQSENPNIYITSPTATTSRYPHPPPLSMNLSTPSLHTMHSLNSPNSSPTAADFPTQLGQQHHQQQAHQHQQQGHHPLSRQHSFQHLNSYAREAGSSGNTAGSTPLPGSPGSGHLEMFDEGLEGRGSMKRPRLDPAASGSGGPGTGVGAGGLSGLAVAKKGVARARSDSAPLGYGHHQQHQQTQMNGGMWGMGAGMGAGRPRSGSGMGPRIPNIGSLTRGAGLLGVSGVGQ